MLSSVRHLADRVSNTASTAVQYANVFYRFRIEDNGKVEKLANEFLRPINAFLDCQWSDKKVTLLSNTYILTTIPKDHEGFFEIMVDLPLGFLKDFLVLQISLAICVVGTVIKLASWLFIDEVFEKNKRLVCLLEKERLCYQDWIVNPKYEESIAHQSKTTWQNKTKKTGEASFEDLPLALLKIVANGLERLKDFYAFGQVSHDFHLAFRQIGPSFIPKKKQELIQANFPKMFQQSIGIETLKAAPIVSLPMHRVSDDPKDSRFQIFGSCGVQDPLHLNTQHVVNAHSVQFGLQPQPFIAIRVKRQVEADAIFPKDSMIYKMVTRHYDTSHFTTSIIKALSKAYMIYKLGLIEGLNKNCLLETDEVLTISKSLEENKWYIKASWLNSQKNLFMEDKPNHFLQQLVYAKGQMTMIKKLKQLLANQPIGDHYNLDGPESLSDGRPVLMLKNISKDTSS